MVRLDPLQVHAVIGVLMDDTDPLVTVMKVEKAPQETYADIGGLDNQIQEIKVWQGPALGFQTSWFLIAVMSRMLWSCFAYLFFLIDSFQL